MLERGFSARPGVPVGPRWLRLPADTGSAQSITKATRKATCNGQADLPHSFILRHRGENGAKRGQRGRRRRERAWEEVWSLLGKNSRRQNSSANKNTALWTSRNNETCALAKVKGKNNKHENRVDLRKTFCQLTHTHTDTVGRGVGIANSPAVSLLKYYIRIKSSNFLLAEGNYEKVDFMSHDRLQ